MQKNVDFSIPSLPVTEVKASGELPMAKLNSQSSSDSNAKNHDFGKHPPIAAERIFDDAVYYGWNYGLQVFASVCAAMWFKEGSGKPYFDKAADWMGKNVMSKITNKTGAEAAKSSHSWLTFASLITVGNLFIPPIQWVEHRKSYFVGKINDHLNARRTAKGNPPTKEELKVQQDAIAAIAQEPLQTSGSLWGGRALGLGANFLASYLVTQERDEKMQNLFAKGVSKSLDTIGLQTLAKSERVKSFSRIAILDYGYSIISANVIYAYSHFINPPKNSKNVEKHSIAMNDAADPQLALSERPEPLHSSPQPSLLSGSNFVQLKPTNPELVKSYESQLAV